MLLEMRNRRTSTGTGTKQKFRSEAKSYVQGFPSYHAAAAEGPPLIGRDV
jgi:hypothetical protein